MKPTAPNSGRTRGFTLLEALIAGAIFFVALVGATLLGVSAQANAARSMAYAFGSRIATQEMERWAMLGYAGIGNYFDGGVIPAIQSYPINEQPDGGGRSYAVTVQFINSRVIYNSAITFPNGIPIPALGNSAAPDVPSYFILVNVTWTQPNGSAQQTVTQGTYVSPSSTY